MPGRRASQRRAEERVKNNEATRETGGGQQTSKGPAQGRGHGGTRGAQHCNKAPEREAQEGQAKGNTKYNGMHRTGTTHTPHTHTRTHSTRAAGLGSPPRGEEGKRGRLNPDAPATPVGRSPPQGTRATGPVQGPQARTPAPTARG